MQSFFRLESIHGTAPMRLADGQLAHGRHADSRHADSRHADSRHADSRHADSRHADSRHADSRGADSRGVPDVAIVVCVDSKRAEVAFLFAADGTALRIVPERVAVPLQVMRLVRLDATERFALSHPVSGRFLLANGELDADGVGEVAFHTDAIDELNHWFLISAEPSTTTDLPARIARLAATSREQALTTLLRTLDASHAAAELDVLAKLYRPEEMAEAAAEALRDPAMLRRLQAVYPDDLWANQALPTLAAWSLRRRDDATAVVLAGVQPTIAVDGRDHATVSLPHACNVQARRAVVPRRDACVLSAMRNEGLHLLEWVAHHRALGFDRLFVYSNDNEDGSDALLQALDFAGEIVWVPNRLQASGSPQAAMLGHALGLSPALLDYRWCLVCDADELLMVNPALFGSVQAYLGWQEARPVDAIALNWLVFPSAGVQRWVDKPMSVRFRRRLPLPQHPIKSLFKPRLFQHGYAHFPITDGRLSYHFRDSAGASHGFAAGNISAAGTREPVADHAWINHYFTKSAEEFAWKWLRNRGDSLDPIASFRDAPADLLEFFLLHHSNATTIDDARTQALVPDLQARIASLMALPGVAAARTGIGAFYDGRARKLAVLLGAQDDAPESPQARFAALLTVAQA